MFGPIKLWVSIIKFSCLWQFRQFISLDSELHSLGFFGHFKAKKPSQQAGRYTTLTCHLISFTVANIQFPIFAHQADTGNHHAIKHHVCVHLMSQYSAFLGLVCSPPTPDKNIWLLLLDVPLSCLYLLFSTGLVVYCRFIRVCQL